MLKRSLLICTAALSSLLIAGPAQAQSSDVSPTLMIESLPSDSGDYRRMLKIHYVDGASYRAYNRAEFKNLNGVRPDVSACRTGAATSLREIKSFEREEAKRAKRGQAPEVKTFCIKGVRNWKGGNQATYLDPLFATLPTGPKRL